MNRNDHNHDHDHDHEGNDSPTPNPGPSQTMEGARRRLPRSFAVGDLRPEGEAPGTPVDDTSSMSSDSLMPEEAEYPPRYHRQERYDALAEQQDDAAPVAQDEAQDHYGIADISVGDADEHPMEENDPAILVDPAPLGLKEISNLGKFTVSSHKQGNGVKELRSDDLKQYWQSDGAQPHKLTVYFIKRVGIRDIRFYVDYNEDESYTPTKIVFRAGTSENFLIDFAVMELQTPSGWQQVPVAGAGGGPDRNTLFCHVFQMQILENHQNGKDTHLRGIKIFAADDAAAAGPELNLVDEMSDLIDAMSGSQQNGQRRRYNEPGFTIPDFMKEPIIR